MSELSDYLDLVEKRKVQQEVISLSMPSGATWRIMPVNMMQYAVAGRLPVEMLVKAASPGGKLTELQKMDLGLQVMEITRDVMLSNLIFPKITPEPSPESICISEVGEKIDPADFEFLKDWLLKGAQVQQNSFRRPTKRKRK